MAKSLEVCALAGVRRPTLPATRGLCRPQSPLVFSAHPETPTAASTISQPRQTCRAAPVGAQVPWTTWGRFAHNSSRARVEVHLPCVLESRSAGQRALAPPTDGHPPDFRTIQTLHNHFPNHPPTAFQPRTNHREPKPIHNRPSTACRTRTCKALLQPSTNHAPTILRVESKNYTISAQPSYIMP